jgi:hypothetical protein
MVLLLTFSGLVASAPLMPDWRVGLTLGVFSLTIFSNLLVSFDAS